MKKHVVWFLALALAGLVGHGAGPVGRADAQQTQAKTLSIATLAPPGSTWMRVFDAWNRELRRRTNQSLQMRFYAGGVQGDESEVIRKIRNGRLDGAAVTAVGLAQIHRPALVFQMPGILRSYEQLDRARAELAPDFDTAFLSSGFKLLGWADVGQSRLFSNTEVRRPADLASKKMFSWRDDVVLPAMFQVIRTNAVPLALPEVLGALQTGRVDTFLGTPVACIALQWCTKASTMMDMPLAIVVGGTVLGKAQWEALSPEHQAALAETAAQFHTLARRNLRNDERQALETLRTRLNIRFVSVDDAQRAEWENVGAQVRQRLTGRVADAALVERVAAFGR
jgi:TRAP-type C4-dicarboxylate transport system substrate-binding protein